ncbi:MAG: LemA family protein [Muribaculaceae bacterium]|nr:LemA family protein [Bacteroides sp.]MDE6804243.1 LemA family protein [Muribaculaceae bacterium]MDE7190799.1 LemA family protein [Muribaculaceae bacterium]
MRKLITRLMVCLAALLGASGLSSCNYNSLVDQQQSTMQAWAQVENQYQRRADLIPNLVNTVKGYATHESETLEKVTLARAKATSITIDANDLNEETLAKYQEAQSELSSALKSLLAVTEAYPDLKANENFMNLQTQLEGTENRIATERMRYTEEVQKYNSSIKHFPTNIYAGWFGFKEMPQFKADAGASKAPEVKF